MGISYAGVSLPVLTPEAYQAIESRLPLKVMCPWGNEPSNVGRGGIGLAAKKFMDREPQIGHLVWPSGASRWATGYFLATDAQLETIRENIGDSYTPANLVLGDGSNSITAKMSMLMARPLLGTVPGSELWLLVLVDQRYFWQTAVAGTSYSNLTYTGGANPYADLQGYLPGSVSIAYDTPTVPAPSLLICPRDPIPPLLDWMAMALGQKIVVGLDGSVHAYNVSTAQTINNRNLSLPNPPIAGGTFALDESKSNDLPSLLPSAVQVDFLPPLYDLSGNTNYPTGSETVSFSSLNLIPNAETNDTVFVFSLPSPNPPSSTVATAWATAFYGWLLSEGDYALAGIAQWQPSGMEEWIGWEYNQWGLGVRTRIHNDVLEYTDTLPEPPEFAYLINTNVNDQEPISPVPSEMPFIIGLSGRTVSDAGTSTSNNHLNSATANFTTDDIGRVVVGAGVANSQLIDSSYVGVSNPIANPPTTITAINSPTQAVMSVNGSATGANETVAILDEWVLGTWMNKTRFNYATSPFGPQDPWPDTLVGDDAFMIAERDGGMATSGYPNFLYNEMVNGMFTVCEKVYRGRLIGADLFGMPLYESRIEPMDWWWRVNPASTSTSTITLAGTGASVTAYSAQILQYSGSHGPGFVQNSSSPGTLGQAYWYSADPLTGAAAPPPSMIIQSRQVDCDSATGRPVFSGYGKLPDVPLATGNFSLPNVTYQYTGLSLTLTQPGTYFVFVIVPGSVAGQLNHGDQLALEVGLKLNGVDYGIRATVAAMSNGGVAWTGTAAEYGTVTIPAFATVTTSSQTFQLWAGVFGNTGSWSAAQVGSNLSTVGTVVIQAVRGGI